MAVSGNEITRIGGYLSGIGKRLSISAKLVALLPAARRARTRWRVFDGQTTTRLFDGQTKTRAFSTRTHPP